MIVLLALLHAVQADFFDDEFDDEKLGSSFFSRQSLPTTEAASDHGPETKRLYKKRKRSDFIDDDKDSGSLWASSGQTNYYFTKNNIRLSGDMMSVTLEQDALSMILDDLKARLNANEKKLYEQQMQEFDAREAVKKDTVSDKKSDPAVKEEKKEAAKNPHEFESIIGIKVGEVMQGEILERYPNGNYKIRAMKRISTSYFGSRVVGIQGLVKGTDIVDDNSTVASGKIYDIQIFFAR